MQRGVIASARAIEADMREEGFEAWEHTRRGWKPSAYAEFSYRCALLTFTYAPDVVWSPLHIATVLSHYRKWAKRNKCRFSYVWTMELHKSGKPHYHVVIWVTGGHTPPFPDAQGWWPHGMSQAKWAHSPVGYIAKYASKGTSADLPRGARLWGAGGLSVSAMAARSWATAPKWVRSLTPAGTKVRRGIMKCAGRFAPRTGWIATLAGVMGLFIGPWIVDRIEDLGVVLGHRGYAEFFTAEGEAFRIPMQMRG